MSTCETQSFPRLSLWAAFALLCVVWPAPVKGHDVLWEDPTSLLPGQEWYLIALDSSGAITRNEGWGYGGGWYYYPLTNTYRQWYYRGPSNPNQSACMTISGAIVRLDTTQLASAVVNYIWTTPAWSARSSGAPPLPENVSTLATESQYVASALFHEVTPSFFTSVEPVQDYTITGYSPEWVGIEIRGRNMKALRFVAPVCATSTVTLGACCNSSTGDCYLTEQSQCAAPYTWKGAGSDCSSCSAKSGTTDFGDAPDSYATLLRSDGARHTIVPGIYLGRLIDGEPDGQPNANATGDDSTGIDDEDGVVFTSPLSPGAPTTLDVTASVKGYLNAWIDFDHRGTFSGTGKQIFTDMLLSPGVNHLTFTVPASAAMGDTFARFRFSTRGLLSWKGLADDGEVEDYKVSIVGAFAPQAPTVRGPAKHVHSPQAAATTPYVYSAWSELSDIYLGQTLADDWQCQDNRPVTGFQWWGTFSGWQESRLPSQLPSAFLIGVWTHNAGTTGSFAHPDTLIWETTCTDWKWNVAGQASDPRKVNPNETSFEFACLLSQDQWFYQDPGSGTKTFWLSIAAIYDANAPVAHPWGWMTDPCSSGSGAVRITGLATSGGSSAWPPQLGCIWSAGTQVKDNRSVIQNMAFNVLTNQGETSPDLNLLPVYRFWSGSMKTHFYTISETEKQKLINLFQDVWIYEGIAFYAYPPGSQPVSAKPVYQFLSARDGSQFYTVSETEKTKLLNAVPNQWIYEGIAWYAYD